MAVVIETTIGDITVDLFLAERPKASLNFLKLCKLKYYNYNLFHTIQHGFVAQTGDPTGSGNGGESIWGVVEGVHKRYFDAEMLPKIRHVEPGLLSMVGSGENMSIGSQFMFTLGPDLSSLDGKHCVIGEVVEGHEVLRKLNEAICDEHNRPYQDIRITHTVILDDLFNDPRGFKEPSRSPSPSASRLQGGRIAADEDIDDMEGKTEAEIAEMLADKEAKARATILEIVGDIPDAEIAPPENVLFVCKLNPVTTDDDLQIIFSRFGKIIGCEVIRDKISGDSLQYAFIEFAERKSCEDAYFKMDNVLIDDRRIHVDFSQSVAKMRWRGKGKGIDYYDEKTKDNSRYIKPGYKNKSERRRSMSRSRSPRQKHNERNDGGRGKYENKYISRDRNQRKRSMSRSKSPRNRDYYRNNRDRSFDYDKYYSKNKNRRLSRSKSPRFEKSRENRMQRKNTEKKSARKSRSHERHRGLEPSPHRHSKDNKDNHSSSKKLYSQSEERKKKKRHSSSSSSDSTSSSSSSSSEEEKRHKKKKKKAGSKTKKSKKHRK